MPRAISAAKWNTYMEFRAQGTSKAAAARAAGISYTAARDFEAGKTPSTGRVVKEARDAAGLTGPTPLDQLCPEAARALEDFGYFRYRYFGRLSTPWQEEAAYKLLDLLDTPRKEFVVENEPPGSGKTTLFTHDIPAWITCKRRSIRGLFGSASQSLADRYGLRLRTTFEAIHPILAEPEEKSLGLAVDAQATLVEDFGNFRPEHATIWKVSEFLVAQHGGVFSGQKESTWTTYGPDTAQIGGRYDLIIWDDLVDEKTIKTLEAILALQKWWDRVAEKRLEPGGLLVLQGQRLSPDDHYRYCLDKEAGGDEDITHDDCCDAEDGKKYHHFKYRAHYEDRCVGDHDETAKYYPEGCLLDPRRLSWKVDLLPEIQNSLSNYMQVYQQEDADPEALLVKMLWINGGTDPVTHEVAPGCWDHNRGLLELPAGLEGPFWSCAVSDPSPTRFWAHQHWIYAQEVEYRYLVNLDRRVMEAPTFLDWNHAEGRFTGLMETWWQQSKDMGHPITHWIVEQNAAQRFLLQYEHVKRWMALRSVRIVAHDTYQNKSDPKMGVTSIAPHYRFGRVRLPGLGAARGVAMQLVDEVTKYPLGRFDDQPMAQWMYEWNRPMLWRPPRKDRTPARRPSYIRPANRAAALGRPH